MTRRHYGLHVTRNGHVGVGRPISELLARAPNPVGVTVHGVDLRPYMPAIYDQGQLGSCTANALCAAIQFVHPKAPIPSRLFLYYNERRMEGDVPNDAGAQLSDGVKCLESIGVCPESSWPYVISKFAMAPTSRCYIDASKNRASRASFAVPCDAVGMKQVLDAGHPFVVGISIFESFESATVASTGVVPMPVAGEQCLGGHAVLCVGYDVVRACWTMRNSWGSQWGDNGYFYLPFAYLLDATLASDAWVIE